MSSSTIYRLWRAHNLQPHRVQNFKFRTDPDFVNTLPDVVGLYMDPPTNAIVLNVDEKSRVQALHPRVAIDRQPHESTIKRTRPIGVCRRPGE